MELMIGDGVEILMMLFLYLSKLIYTDNREDGVHRTTIECALNGNMVEEISKNK